MLLHDPSRHEPLHAEPWSEARARETIEEIVAEAVATFSPDSLFPAHPMDELGTANAGSAHYFGAGGVLWALDYLNRGGFARLDTGGRGESKDDPQWLIDGLTAIVDRIPSELEYSPMRNEVSYLFGELPLLLQLFNLTGEAVWQERIVERVTASVAAPVREMMWGTPGVLIAIRLVTDKTLRDAVKASERENIAKLFDSWDHEANGLTVWKQELYGAHRLFIGPVHGFAGQVLPLLQRLDELDAEQSRLTLDRAKAHLLQTAVRDGGCANWPAIQLDAGVDPAEIRFLVQYCHGAPGVVISFCAYPPDDDVDRVLTEGAELIWQAGPLTKGSNLCHGTGGNGYAFLKLYERAGDAEWLDRARQFAMHGIYQYRAEHAKVGHQRFSLWTGDPGFAIYLAGCIDGDAAFPTLDVF